MPTGQTIVILLWIWHLGIMVLQSHMCQARYFLLAPINYSSVKIKIKYRQPFVQILRQNNAAQTQTPFGTFVTILNWSNNMFCFSFLIPSPLRKRPECRVALKWFQWNDAQPAALLQNFSAYWNGFIGKGEAFYSLILLSFILSMPSYYFYFHLTVKAY